MVHGLANAAPVVLLELQYLEDYDYWPCAGGLSAVNVISTQWCDPINSGLTRWRKAFNLNVEDEKADAGRDGRTCPARPNSQARTWTGKYSLLLFSRPRAGLATLPG